MVRKPRSPALSSDRARAWAAMRNFEQRRQAFTVEQLRLVLQDEPGVLEGDAQNLTRYVVRLERVGYLRRISGKRTARAWRLDRDTGPLPPVFRRDGSLVDANIGAGPDVSLRSRVWRLIRMRGAAGESFTVDQLHAEPEICSDKRVAVWAYVARLGRAGYLERLSADRQFVWRLVRDTGPSAPRPSPGGGLLDPNTSETFSAPRIPSRLHESGGLKELAP